jgi:ATP-dependent RNA helicase RhlE
MDLYNHNVLSLKKIKVLVIDEADRMLDMGFYASAQENI